MKKSKYRKSILIGLSIIALTLIILVAWAKNYPPYKSPIPIDIIGVWFPNHDLRHKVLPEPPLSFYKVRLEIYSDNKFKLINIPEGFIDNKSKNITYSGTWSLNDGTPGECASLNVHYSEINLYSNFLICGRQTYLIEHHTDTPQELIYFSKQK